LSVTLKEKNYRTDIALNTLEGVIFFYAMDMYGFETNNYRMSGVIPDSKRIRVFTSNCQEEYFPNLFTSPDCIVWTGTKEKRGPGFLSIKGKRYTLRPLIYCWANAVHISSVQKLTISMMCKNIKCINHAHMRVKNKRVRAKKKIKK
jgi:hypothetical protein